MTRNTFPVAAAAVAVGLLAAPAAAEPIRWSYAFDFGGDNGNSWLQVGGLYRYDYDWGSGYGQYWYPEVVPLRERQRTDGRRRGDGRVTLGTTRLSDVRLLYPDPYPAAGQEYDTYFRASFTLTDAASGQSGTVGLLGYGRNGRMWEAYWGEPSERTLVLGRNRYDVDLRVDQSAGGSAVRAYVTAAVETPEPAGLVLAGVGLTAVAARRLRRRGG